MKVETYLRLTGIAYKTKALNNPGKAPKGKLPFIIDGDRTVADSYFIFEYLKGKFGDPLGHGLSEEMRADHFILARMIEEHFRFTVIHSRWLRPENATLIREAAFASVPSAIRGIVFSMVQKKLRKALIGQGMGRHNREEIDKLAVDDINILSIKLGSGDFFGGASPREIDCTAWPFIAGILDTPFTGAHLDAVRAHPNLVSYNARMWEKAFPDFASV